MKIIFAVFLIAFCSFSLVGQSIVTKKEYVVYAGVFENIYAEGFKRDGFKTSFVVLDKSIEPNFTSLEKHLNNNRTSDYLYKTNPSSELFPAAFEVLLNDFKENNKQPAKVEKQFPIEYEYKIITKNEIEELLTTGEKEYQEILKTSSNPYFGNKLGFVFGAPGK